MLLQQTIRINLTVAGGLPWECLRLFFIILERGIYMRKKIIAGNWKMNMVPSEALKLVETLKPLVQNEDVDVVYCVPAIDLVPVVNAVKGSNVHVGA